jgi:hypothetical protein
MWGLGRRIAPTDRGRRGCMLMLVCALALIVLALVVSIIAGTF